ncbi:MAG: glycine zipper family protein [Pseudomonadota bacterium]
MNFNSRYRFTAAFAAVFLVALAGLAGCAATGPNSPSARPVLYPNATLNRVGAAQGQVEVDGCISRAMAAGLTPDEKTNAVARRAGEGAATAGVASAVGALLTGRSSDVLRSGAIGAAVGGSAGAVSGAFHNDKPNGTYRQFVQRCLSERGFDVIGWN